MTTGEMLGFTNRFNEIRKSKAPRFIKNKRLKALLNDIEEAYLFDGYATRLYYTVANDL